MKTIQQLCRELRQNQTAAEQQLWGILRARKFIGLKFRRQHPFIDNNRQGQSRFFIADFYCPEKRLVIELDGKIHDWQKDYDENRDLILTQLGLKVLRLKNEELDDLGAVLEKLKAVL